MGPAATPRRPPIDADGQRPQRTSRPPLRPGTHPDRLAAEPGRARRRARADRVRDAYGPHRFGQCCLIARRLVEAGIPFVQVNWSTHVEGPEDAGDGGWDMHDRYFQVMQDRHGWMLDRALSALLDDLHDRGLLDSTLVVAVGEFGRTPKINDRAGRDHWNTATRPSSPAEASAAARSSARPTVAASIPSIGLSPPPTSGATILARLGSEPPT